MIVGFHRSHVWPQIPYLIHLGQKTSTTACLSKVCANTSLHCLVCLKRKKKNNNKRSWHNLLFSSTCLKNDLLNFICAFFVWSGPYLNLHIWVSNFSEFKFIWFHTYLIISACYKYANVSVAIVVLNACFGPYLWQESFYDDIPLVY